MTDPTRAALEQAANELDIAENALLCSSFHNAASRAKQAAMTARAALSQPEPAGLSDEELLTVQRAVLTRWGRQVPMESKFSIEWAIDALERLRDASMRYRLGVFSQEELQLYEDRAQKVIEAWSRGDEHEMSGSDATPQPVPPEPGEVEELVSSLRSQRANYLEKLQRLERYDQVLSAVMPNDFKDWWENSRDEWPDVAAGVITNLRQREELAWEQVERLSPPQPVPVSERPWEREGWCDGAGKCWWGRSADEYCNHDWHYATRAEVEEFCSDAMPQVSLPAHALPLPGEVEG